MKLGKKPFRIPEQPNPLAVATGSLKVNIDDIPVRVGYPRASSILSSCLRMHVLGSKFELYRKRKFNSLPSRIAFSIGNAYHHWIQNSPDIYGDTRRGWWKCLACRKVTHFGAPPIKNCPHCGAYPEAIQYMEHPMVIKGNPWYFSGHPDLYLTTGTKLKDHLVTNELKSIKNSGNGESWDWDKLIEPLADHKAQVMSYMINSEYDDIFKKKGILIDSTVARISYIAKGNFGNLLPIKTFEVIRKDHKDIEEQIKGRLLIFKKAYENFPKFLPECLDKCKHSEFTNYQAKDCPAIKQCKEFFEQGIK